MRSPLLMSADDTALLIVDIQEKLAAAMSHQDLVIANADRLVQAARIVGVPVFATEQYPKGLGPTVAPLADRKLAPVEKIAFSCCGEPDLVRRLQASRVGKVLVVGMETHVCVQQTALDLISQDFAVYVAADAVCSRRKQDWRFALERMNQAGVTLTTTEAAIFEWLERAGTDAFKQVLPLVK